MKVICAGLSKTGTTSINAALTELGYNVYDHQENLMFLHDQWMRVIQEGFTKEDFYEMYKNVDATCDAPAYYFWEDILEAFPDAKVILSYRDNEDVWFQSMDHQLRRFGTWLPLFCMVMSKTYRKFWHYSVNAGMVNFGSKTVHFLDVELRTDEVIFKQAYRRHNAYVVNACPKDRLLVFHCRDGWKPLCEFLGKSIPDKPFPRRNVGGEIAERIWHTPMFKQIKKELYVSCGVFITIFIGVPAALFAWKRMM